MNGTLIVLCGAFLLRLTRRNLGEMIRGRQPL
jgi:hypothetical protein